MSCRKCVAIQADKDTRMTPPLTKPFMMTAFFALVACGGGSGDDSGGGGGGGGGGTPTAGNNGLDFGFSGQELSDAEGTAITMRTASFRAGSGPSIDDATITLDAGFFNGSIPNNPDLDGTIQIFDQTVTITNGVGRLTPGGEEVRATYEPNRSGTYAGALDITVSSAAMGTINGEGAYVFGFETNPATISGFTRGSVIYNGSFQAIGSVTGSSDINSEFEGGITVTVNFGTDRANVLMNGAGGVTADLTGTNIPLTGNGFVGQLSCAPSCGSDSEIDATFYGPNADELGGVLSIDINVAGTDFDGVGTFVIPR
jgi:hypothetical protein